MDQTTSLLRILVLDGDKDLYDLVVAECAQGQVGASQYDVHYAHDAASAMATLRDSGIDILLCSTRLADADGQELCKSLREDPLYAHMYVIMLVDEAGVVRSIGEVGHGADDYIRKPVVLDELRLRLRTAERVKVLEQKVRANEGTTSLYRSLRTLIHDVSNPLSVILTEIEVLKRTNPELPDDMKECLESIRSQVLEIKHMLQQVRLAQEES